MLKFRNDGVGKKLFKIKKYYVHIISFGKK
jgi:hypothetical protein